MGVRPQRRFLGAGQKCDGSGAVEKTKPSASDDSKHHGRPVESEWTRVGASGKHPQRRWLLLSRTRGTICPVRCCGEPRGMTMPGTVPAAPKNAGCFSKNYASIPLSTIGHLTLPKARSFLSEWGSMLFRKRRRRRLASCAAPVNHCEDDGVCGGHRLGSGSRNSAAVPPLLISSI